MPAGKKRVTVIMACIVYVTVSSSLSLLYTDLWKEGSSMK